MASGFGVDPTKNGSGVITSGTTAQDIRKIWSGLYSPGIISGCVITRSSSAMTYTVSAGVACIQMSSGENVLVPVPATTVTAATVPAGASRTDIIYAQQRTPAVEGDSNIIVTYGTTLPARAIKLDQYSQPAGATNTNAGSRSAFLDFAIPYGSGLGNLHYHQYTTNGFLPNNLTYIGNGNIYLPTDRTVTFSVRATLYADGASGFDNSKYCEYGFSVVVDNNEVMLWTTPGLHQAWASYSFSRTAGLAAGSHTVKLGVYRIVGPGQGVCFYGFNRHGIEFSVDDAGVIK